MMCDTFSVWILSIFQQPPGDHVPDDISTAMICFQETSKYGVDPGMTEEVKVDYLFRGVKPTLVGKIRVTSPRTTAEFLTAVQLHTEASELAIRPEWVVSVLEPMKGLPPPKEEARTELGNLVLEWKAEIAKAEKGQDQKSATPKEDEKGGQRSDRRDKGENRRRNDRYKEGDSGEAAVLLINSSRQITEEVVCRGIRIKALIDPGAVVSVASPSLQEKLGARRMGWDGPSFVMINGQRTAPLGALELEIEHREMKASGKVIVLERKGIDLLLGNDFLSQFKRLQIIYVPTGVELLLGELLVNGTVFGQMEVVEPSIVAVDEVGTPDSLGDDVREDAAESVSGSDSTLRVTSIPRQGFRAQVASTLPPADVEKLVELLQKFDTSFALKEGKLGMCKIAEHRINTGTAAPVHQSPYKSAWKERVIVQKKVDIMLGRSVIERSTIPWASHVVLVKKKEWKLAFLCRLSPPQRPISKG
ncbi:Uncharacterized protein APZ42_030324 [Daphnia magna]|uniref:Peptidase A2 domain-containing protein n=1 Tax=Daphnia magna TaxID=35525 RepID=A0A164NVI5_9CRUS|nr:Uncharacterized protein APZ42_030324 [Daphnia magna]